MGARVWGEEVKRPRRIRPRTHVKGACRALAKWRASPRRAQLMTQFPHDDDVACENELRQFDFERTRKRVGWARSVSFLLLYPLP